MNTRTVLVGAFVLVGSGCNPEPLPPKTPTLTSAEWVSQSGTTTTGAYYSPPSSAPVTPTPTPVRTPTPAPVASPAVEPTVAPDAESELRITNRITKGMADDWTLSSTAAGVRVSTIGTTVVLQGAVRSNYEREAIERLARQTAGVQAVDNRLEITKK